MRKDAILEEGGMGVRAVYLLLFCKLPVYGCVSEEQLDRFMYLLSYAALIIVILLVIGSLCLLLVLSMINLQRRDD